MTGLLPGMGFVIEINHRLSGWIVLRGYSFTTEKAAAHHARGFLCDWRIVPDG